MKKKKENFCKRNYRACWNFLKESKNYVWFAVLIFLLFTIIGFVFPMFFQDKIFALLEELALKFEGLGVLETMGFIFLNNLRASFFAILLGLTFGIFPFLTGVINGYILGVVARHSVAQEGILVLWRLLPHGIFELPAVLISIGFGLKIGMGIFKERKDSWKSLKRNLKESFRFFIFVILPLLLIAGIIEGLLIFYIG